MPKYIEQFKRMERWLKRIEVIYEKTPKDMGDFEDEDDFYAFFQNCFHLKEWIINDESLGASKEEVEKYIQDSVYLRICGDLCVGSKHLKIKNPKIDTETKLNRHYVVGETINSPIHHRYFVVTSNGKKRDALILAKECVEEWNRFFKNQGISWF